MLPVIEALFDLEVVVGLIIFFVEEVVVSLRHVPFGLRWRGEWLRHRRTRGNQHGGARRIAFVVPFIHFLILTWDPQIRRQSGDPKWSVVGGRLGRPG